MKKNQLFSIKILVLVQSDNETEPRLDSNSAAPLKSVYQEQNVNLTLILNLIFQFKICILKVESVASTHCCL